MVRTSRRRLLKPSVIILLSINPQLDAEPNPNILISILRRQRSYGPRPVNKSAEVQTEIGVFDGAQRELIATMGNWGKLTVHDDSLG
jgi:hypothetical protein